MLWVTTAAVCLFTYLLVRGVARTAEQARFLLAGGLLTAVLGLDDLYLFHERIAPRFLPEKVVLATYGLLVAGLLFRFRRLLQSLGDVLLGGALTALGGSMVVDLVAPNRGWYHLTEDGLKFIGISLWAAFYIRYAYAVARGLAGPARGTDPRACRWKTEDPRRVQYRPPRCYDFGSGREARAGRDQPH